MIGKENVAGFVISMAEQSISHTFFKKNLDLIPVIEFPKVPLRKNVLTKLKH